MGKGAYIMGSDNLISAIVHREKEAYRAMVDLRQAPRTAQYVLSQVSMVKRSGGKIVTVDSFDTGYKTENDTVAGGLVGGVVGLLCGPAGVLAGGAMGAVAGGVVDSADEQMGNSMIERMAGQLRDGDVAIIALAHEEDRSALDAAFAQYGVFVTRADSMEAAREVRKAERDKDKQFLTQQKAEVKQYHQERRAFIKSDFQSLKTELKNGSAE